MSQKPTGFASFRRCQLAGEGCGAVLWSMVGAGGRCDWLGVRWGYGGVALYPIR